MHSYALKYYFYLTCNVVLIYSPIIIFMGDECGHVKDLPAYKKKCYGLLSVHLDIIRIFFTFIMIFSYIKSTIYIGFFFNHLFRIISLHILSKVFLDISRIAEQREEIIITRTYLLDVLDMLVLEYCPTITNKQDFSSTYVKRNRTTTF